MLFAAQTSKNPTTFSYYLQFSIKLIYNNTGKVPLSPFANLLDHWKSYMAGTAVFDVSLVLVVFTLEVYSLKRANNILQTPNTQLWGFFSSHFHCNAK